MEYDLVELDVLLSVEATWCGGLENIYRCERKYCVASVEPWSSHEMLMTQLMLRSTEYAYLENRFWCLASSSFDSKDTT